MQSSGRIGNAAICADDHDDEAGDGPYGDDNDDDAGEGKGRGDEDVNAAGKGQRAE